MMVGMSDFYSMSDLGIEHTSYVGEVRFTVEGEPLVRLRHSSVPEVVERVLQRLDGSEGFSAALEVLVAARERVVRGGDFTASRDARRACTRLRELFVDESVALPSVLKDF